MRNAREFVFASLLVASIAPASAADPDLSKVDQASGRTGSDQPGRVHKYGLPRSDLHVTPDGANHGIRTALDKVDVANSRFSKTVEPSVYRHRGGDPVCPRDPCAKLRR